MASATPGKPPPKAASLENEPHSAEGRCGVHSPCAAAILYPARRADGRCRRRCERSEPATGRPRREAAHP